DRQRLSRRGDGSADQSRRCRFRDRTRYAHRPDGAGPGRPAGGGRAQPCWRHCARRRRLRLDGDGLIMTATQPPKLVIFDCDGVLVNTEERANRVLAQWLSETGLPVSYEDCRRIYSGRSMKSVQAEIEAQGHQLGFNLMERWYGSLDMIFGTDVEAIPHVETVLDDLRARNVTWCVASSAKLEKMHLTLGVTGLIAHFGDVLYSATMVENGKPAPDLFLHAAREMGFAP